MNSSTNSYLYVFVQWRGRKSCVFIFSCVSLFFFSSCTFLTNFPVYLFPRTILMLKTCTRQWFFVGLFVETFCSYSLNFARDIRKYKFNTHCIVREKEKRVKIILSHELSRKRKLLLCSALWFSEANLKLQVKLPNESLLHICISKKALILSWECTIDGFIQWHLLTLPQCKHFFLRQHEMQYESIELFLPSSFFVCCLQFC